MDNDSPAAVGPVFGPDFVVIVVNDETGMQYHLNVFPDYNNPVLKANGLQQQYYFLPQRVYLAKKQNSPQDYDFGMTVFKGLMTSEDTVGVTSASTDPTSGDVEVGGGFCSFSTTFAIPDSVIANAIKALKAGNYSNTPAPRIVPYMTYQDGDLDPRLGIVPILSNNVEIDVPQFDATSGATKNPLVVKAQGTGKGSVEASGISAFLVTCNQMAAGAIAGSLKNGVSPFMVKYNLSCQFFLPACHIEVDIDEDKVFDSFSVAASASGWFSSVNFQAAWSNTITSGAITTKMRINNAELPDDLKKWITQYVQDMQTQAINIVKKDIFDWAPTDGGPAEAQGTGGGIFSSIFGGASVSMKKNYQRKSIHQRFVLDLDTTISVDQSPSGDLSDLEPAVKANLGKYLAIVDIGEYFKKIQVAATNSVNWDEKLPDGTSLADPLTAVMVSASYPDYSQPLGGDGKPNLKTLAQGFHYQIGSTNGQSGLAEWSANNPRDVVNISFLRLDTTVQNWPADQVQLKKTLVFDPNDPRVDLAGNKTTVEVTSVGNDHAPVIAPSEVGYVYTKFFVRPLPPNVTLTLTTTLGARNDTITITNANQKNIIWEIFSDKYVGETKFTYKLHVEVDGPDFTDDPIAYDSPAAVVVALPAGRVKWVNAVGLQLPDAPADQKAKINDYIKRYKAS